ncbi:MAG: WD40 repeat domain-containing protein [Anaerolineae bacterium]|nr:WD40 repeat domain-containing protein [Anaerolineae bacterium]
MLELADKTRHPVPFTAPPRGVTHTRFWHIDGGSTASILQYNRYLMNWPVNQPLTHVLLTPKPKAFEHAVLLTQFNGIEIWDVLAGKKIETIPATGSIIRWNTTFNYLAIVAHNKIEVWSMDELTRVGQYNIHDKGISDIQWVTDGAVLASIDISGTINLTDVETGNILNSVNIER